MGRRDDSGGKLNLPMWEKLWGDDDNTDGLMDLWEPRKAGGLGPIADFVPKYRNASALSLLEMDNSESAFLRILGTLFRAR